MNMVLPAAFGPAPVPLIPESAPFSPAQRAWLNGFLAGIYGGVSSGSAAPPPPAAVEEDLPWHDPGLGLEERLSMSTGRAMPQRLMSAMAQLDCGQCGYVCRSYGEALASGAETSTALCVPGAKATQKALKTLLAEAPAAAAPAKAAAPAGPVREPVRFVAAYPLSAPGSAKDVRHVVLDLSGTSLSYEPGDSLSVAAENDPALVTAVLDALGATGEEPTPDGVPLREALHRHRDVARPLDRTLDLLAGAAKHPPHAKALRALADGDDGAEPADADLLDLLAAFPSARPSIADLVASLPALKPRLYSIASSPLATPDHVELCVGVVRPERRGRHRDGPASCHLAFRASGEVPLHASVQTSHFRLPADPATPIIMVGPGTGIAPFRAFLQHRAAMAASDGAKGRSWLFFGDQKRGTDFLFGRELEAWRADGTLGRLSLAWSRDGANKVYVQDRMAQEAPDLWRWLQDGAHFYVCGDASRMAKDVDTALRGIAMSEGGMSADQARDWIVALARQRRYQRDVY